MVFAGKQPTRRPIMRHIMRASFATIIGAAALASVGCTERVQYRTDNDSAFFHMDRSWAPYVSEYGADTGVTGSSASPYVGGGVINQKPDPAPPATVRTEKTTVIRRDY
jgi:hypothetical protein